jgi:hypothetical protein
VPTAQAVPPRARTLAEEQGPRRVVVNYDALRGIERAGLTPFQRPRTGLGSLSS